MTLAQAGSRGDAGVSVAKVNLKLIWDVVSRIKVGATGAGLRGRCCGAPHCPSRHQPGVAQHGFLRLGTSAAALSGTADAPGAKDGLGRGVGSVCSDRAARMVGLCRAAISEAFAPLYASLIAIGIVLIAGLILAVLASLFLARKLTTPIQALKPAQPGSGPAPSITGSISRLATSFRR